MALSHAIAELQCGAVFRCSVSRRFAIAIVFECENPIIPPFFNCLASSLPFSFSFWKWRLGLILLLYPVTLSIGLSSPSFLLFRWPSNFWRQQDCRRLDWRRQSEFPVAAVCFSSLFFPPISLCSLFLPSSIPLLSAVSPSIYLFFPFYFLFSL